MSSLAVRVIKFISVGVIFGTVVGIGLYYKTKSPSEIWTAIAMGSIPIVVVVIVAVPSIFVLFRGGK